MVIACKHVWNYLSALIDDDLDPGTRELVQKHLEHCEICSAILDSTRNIVVFIADDRVFELPVGFKRNWTLSSAVFSSVMARCAQSCESRPLAPPASS